MCQVSEIFISFQVSSMSSSDGSADPQPDISQFNQRCLENDNLQGIVFCLVFDDDLYCMHLLVH